MSYGRVVDRVYALVHQLESELERRRDHEADDFIAGVKAGQQAEKRTLLERLHWVLDPETWTEDLRDADELVRRLNGDR